MEAPLRFSVIVASRGRPDYLRRSLRAIRQLDYPAFETIVVGDESALAEAEAVGEGGFRVAKFDQPNLSAARNIGACLSAGDVCAFIDDDAVPEPMWLHHHAVGLRRTGAMASVGYVRGPDGIRFQTRFASIDQEAETHEEPTESEAAFVPKLPSGKAVKLVGTNMAIRRDLLLGIGGFDPAFRYFLEDGDLSLRLARAGHETAVVPLAEVHHTLAGSMRRTPVRVPRTLFDIGRSTAIFLRRHPGADPEEIRIRIHLRERRRLIRAMVRGLLEPQDVSQLMYTLDEGWVDGLRENLTDLPALHSSGQNFEPITVLPSGHAAIGCRNLFRCEGLSRANEFVASGIGRASLFCLSLTKRPHSVRYTDEGVWLQTGGQFAESDRTKKRFRWCRFANRVEEEFRRVAKRRGLNDCNFVTKPIGKRL